MRPSAAVRRCLTSGYARFSGRAGRAEFWWFFLFALVANVLAGQVDAALGHGAPGPETLASPRGIAATLMISGGPVATVAGYALLLPNLAAGARRLHDTGRSGWWQLAVAVPVVGLALLLWFWSRPPELRENRFGPPPPAPAPSS